MSSKRALGFDALAEAHRGTEQGKLFESMRRGGGHLANPLRTGAAARHIASGGASDIFLVDGARGAGPLVLKLIHGNVPAEVAQEDVAREYYGCVRGTAVYASMYPHLGLPPPFPQIRGWTRDPATGRYGVLMEYLPAPSLAKQLEAVTAASADGEWAVPIAMREGYARRLVSRRLLPALRSLLAANVHHCDVKPDNVVFRAPPRGPMELSDADSAVLIDLGGSAFEGSGEFGMQTYPSIACSLAGAPGSACLCEQGTDVAGLATIVLAIVSGRVRARDSLRRLMGTLPEHRSVPGIAPNTYAASMLPGGASNELKDLVNRCLGTGGRIVPGGYIETLQRFEEHPWMAVAGAP